MYRSKGLGLRDRGFGVRGEGFDEVESGAWYRRLGVLR
jgi:hypothetical protein